MEPQINLSQISKAAIRKLQKYLKTVGYPIPTMASNGDLALKAISKSGIQWDWSLIKASDGITLASFTTNTAIDDFLARANQGDPAAQETLSHLPPPLNREVAPIAPPQPERPVLPPIPAPIPAPIPELPVVTAPPAVQVVEPEQVVPDAVVPEPEVPRPVEITVERELTPLEKLTETIATMSTEMREMREEMRMMYENIIDRIGVFQVAPAAANLEEPDEETEEEQEDLEAVPEDDAEDPATTIVENEETKRLLGDWTKKRFAFNQNGELICLRCGWASKGVTWKSGVKSVRTGCSRHSSSHPEPQLVGSVMHDDEGPEDVSPHGIRQINKVVASAEIVAAPSGIKYQDTTREMYLTNVRRVLSRLPKEYRTKEFFKATDQVRAAIVAKDLSRSTQSSLAAAVNGWVQNFDGRVSEMRKYKEFYGRLLSELKDTGVAPGTLTAKQMAHWVRYEELVRKQQERLKQYQEELAKPVNAPLKQLLDDPNNVDFDHAPPRIGDRMKNATKYALTTALYVLLPPLRDKDTFMLDKHPPADGSTRVNWIDWNKHLMVRNVYKTAGRYKTTEIALPTQLYELFRAQAHVTGNSTDILIPSPRGKRYTTQFGLLIESAFGLAGLNIDTIRLVFATTFGEEFRHNHDLSTEISRIMGHGTEMHESHYIKRSYIDEGGAVVDLPAEFFRQNQTELAPWREAMGEAQEVQRRLTQAAPPSS
ncbi:hypothetical protein PAPYR_11050 [Paratrimastix pyriformis]|uniref:Uncharacterized protein n=1 Tax=Paratrimastix pyriformis TaxID=342808 RepID=A0ABQ8U9M8_9EUKA|nr:hypothetical protein PAPYR_11050 [Paratrimastix pyriformis]